MRKVAYSLCFFLLIFCLGAEGHTAVPILKVRHWSDVKYTRIVVDLGGSALKKDVLATDPSTLSIRVNGVSLPQGRKELAVNDRLIRSVVIDPKEKESAEIKISLVKPCQYKIFTLPAAGEKPDRLVIDIFMSEAPARAESVPTPMSSGEKADRFSESPPEDREKEAVSKALPPKKKEKPTPASGPRLLEIRHWAAPDHSRVVVDLEGTPEYETVPSPTPLTFTVLLRKTALAKGRQEIAVSDQIIRKMVAEPEGKENVQITLSLMKPGRCSVFVLKPYEDKPDRLVIDVFRPDLEEKEKAERKVSQELKTKKTRIIVIDPGHGGEDPGAIGSGGTREKDVVLALAKKLQKILDESGEFKAFLTRRGDYFVPLHDRVRIAKEYGADLFVSLHANANASRHVRGTAVYCLSPHGATDKAAQLLAQQENASDIIGGAATGASRKDLDSILIDLQVTHTINESLQLGGVMLGELKSVNTIQSPRPRQAGFAVLRAPSIPSVLVEVAYLSHPVEEKYLKQEKFQMEAIKAIVNSIKKFMPILALKEEDIGEATKGKKVRKEG